MPARTTARRVARILSRCANRIVLIKLATMLLYYIQGACQEMGELIRGCVVRSKCVGERVVQEIFREYLPAKNRI